jgi:hypothetical protein
MAQLSLSSFMESDHVSEATKLIAVFDCRNCIRPKEFKGAKVFCMGKLKDIPLDGCSCWSDGKELEFMASIAPSPGFVAKKYAGQ